MTRVSIAPSDIEEDITAEQVAAYLLSPKRGWVEWSTVNATRAFRWEGTNPILVIVPREVDSQVIRGIARAEGRHPSAVLADIVGPARAASMGAYCEPWLFVAELRVRLSCKLPACDLMGCSAARGAGEESA